MFNVVVKNKNYEYNFYYKNVVRNLLMMKSVYYKDKNNTYNLCSIKKIIISVTKYKVMDLDSRSLYQFFYLFWFVFGKRAYFSKIKSFFILGDWYYSFSIKLILLKSEVFKCFSFLIHEWFPFVLEKRLLNIGLFSDKLNIRYITLKDFHRISDINKSFGFFNKQDMLNIRIFFMGGTLNSSLALLNLVKMS